MSLNFFHNAFPDVQLLTNCHRMFLREIIVRIIYIYSLLLIYFARLM